MFAGSSAVGVAHACSECQGMFPTQEALVQHLIWHNQLRAANAVSPSPPPPTTSIPQQKQTVFMPPPPPPPPIQATNSGLQPGIIEMFDENRGFGFIKRSSPGADTTRVHFSRGVWADASVIPRRGMSILFAEKRTAKGFTATTVRNAARSAPAQATRDTEIAVIPAVVVSYRPEGGIGSVAKLDGSSGPNLYFQNSFCDIKRPPPTPGERVLIAEGITKKGPSATIVRRITIQVGPGTGTGITAGTPKKKPIKATPRAKPPSFSNADRLAALTRAMAMVANSPRAKPVAANGAQPQSVLETAQTGLKPEQYQRMMEDLGTPEGRDVYMTSALAMLARTQPVQAEHLRAIEDRETQSLMVVMALEDERDTAQRRALLELPTEDFASELDFGYARLPSPVASQRSATAAPTPVPEPAPEPPRTKYCGICMDDTPLEDVFCVSACDHTYCRDYIHPYIKDKIDNQDVMPKCPHDGCEAILSDGDLTLVLTLDEQEEYYKICQDLAVSSVPGLFQCLQENCRGIGVLADDDPHFVCPLCRAERCVQCNTRQWHAGLTCEQARQRTADSELHPEQLRAMYGNKAVYQCGQCSFGPIETQFCANLRTHHGEAVGRARINNACPNCNWFADDISKWPLWNGRMHAQPAAAQ